MVYALKSFTDDDVIDSVRRDFDRMLSRMYPTLERTGGVPCPVDMREDEQAVYVDAEVPGFAENEIQVSVDNGVLAIVAEHQTGGQEPERETDQKKKEQSRQHLTERTYRRIERRVALPIDVDDEHAEAKLEQGVLCLKLPKREHARPRRIPVSA